MLPPKPAVAALLAATLTGCLFDSWSEPHGNLAELELAPVLTDPSEIPQYGGTLDIGSLYVTLSALSWDTADWAWKSNHDTGMFYEQLFAADLDKSVKKGGPHRFYLEAFMPSDGIRGELAESWEWETPLRLVVKLRRGVRIPGKPGVLEERELDAQDVLFSFERLDASPKKIPTYFDHIESVTVRDSHTVVFQFSEYNAEWEYRFGYGFYSAIVPRELEDVDASDWRNTVGSGPFQLSQYRQGNVQTYERNQLYWDTETLGGKQYPIPFVDAIRYRIIKDEATYMTALRTGKIDILENIRWIAVEHLRSTTPELHWSRWLGTVGTFLSMRVDREPFDDIRVRRALNMAIDKQQIVDHFFGGNAELFAYPMHPDFTGYFEPLEQMPSSVQELFRYDPDKARALLAEAGYPDGFSFTTQVNVNNPIHVDLVPLLADHLARVGVTMTIEPLEYSAFLSLMTTRQHAAGYLLDSGHTTPTTTLRKSFVTGQTWNPSMWSDPDFDRRIWDVHRIRDEAERQEILKQLNREILDQAPYIWLPVAYRHTAWWPWVKNYSGELRAGAVRPGPIYARIWIDQELKREMGFGD